MKRLEFLKRGSIKWKFFVATGTVAVVFIGALLLLNLFFYDDYDLQSRRRELRSVYQSICASYKTDSDSLFTALDEVENSGAVRLAVAAMAKDDVGDDVWNVYTSGFQPELKTWDGGGPLFTTPQLPFLYQDMPGGRNDQELRGYSVLKAIIGQTDWSMLSENRQYLFLNVSLHENDQYLCLAGALSDGQYLLAYMPYAFIERNSTFNLTFLLIAGGCSLLICLVCAFFISRQFSRPLIEMADVADKMAELDFSTKCKVNGTDEIGQLGQSLNRLSAYLEQAIGELQDSNEQLAQEVKERERIDGMRQEFIVNVSHELKTPLALIQGYAEGLTAGVADDPEDRQFYCDTIADEANHMNSLVMQLLSLSRLELGAEQTYTDDVDLCELCQDAVTKTAVLCESKGLRVTCVGDNVVIRTDGDLLSQVIMNYLSNAIRYTEDGCVIELRVEQTDGGARLSVFNEGDGLPEDELPKIWEKFYRTDRARSRENGGTGIGLALVRAIADTLHGSCGVENVDGGILFWFVVPDAETSA